MADLEKEMNKGLRRSTPKFTSGMDKLPDLISTFVKTQLGLKAWDFDITQEKMEALLLDHLKKNPDAIKAFSVVSYTMSSGTQEAIAHIKGQQAKIKQRGEKRQAAYDKWADKKLFDKKGNPIPAEKLSQKTLKEKDAWESKLEAGDKADNREYHALSEAKKNEQYMEEVKVRRAEDETARNKKEATEMMKSLATAEQKKEDEKEKRKRAKAKLVGGAIADAISGVGEGFNLGRRIRGY